MAGLATEGPELPFVATDSGGDCFEAVTELVELDDQATEGVCLSVPVPVLFDEGT